MHYDVIIIGAGPAGLTAGLYAGRYRMKTLMLEKMSVGGRILLTTTVDNYPGFPEGITSAELSQRMHDQVKKAGVQIKTEEVVAIDPAHKSVRTDAGEYRADAMIIATGAYPRKLGVAGEDMFVGRGVSYCATCDAPFFRDKKIVVVGGGNSVAEESLYLVKYARAVTIVHRRDELRASPALQEELQKESAIDFRLSSVVTEIKGEKNVSGVVLKNVVTQEESLESCDGVFIFIGYEPDTALFTDAVRVDEKGFILTDRAMATNADGIFACGDCCQKQLFQVITAAAEGAIAADSAFTYVSQKKR